MKRARGLGWEGLGRRRGGREGREGVDLEESENECEREGSVKRKVGDLYTEI